jgi:peptide/nickel transport system permease protein
MRFSTLANRIGHLLAVMLLVTIATFGMLELLPGNLAYSILGEGAKPEDVARVEKELGLDRPLPERFAGWLGNAVTGDLGKSYATGQHVSEAIAQRLPVSLQLMIMAQVLALVLAVPLGLWAGYREGGTVDRIISSGAFGILAVPHFVLGIVLILLLAVWLRWLPASGFVAFGTDPVGNIRAMILPSLTLALVEAPVYMRLLRSDVASTLREEFILVARAKGLSDWRILLTHALRPSSFSLVTVMGINIGHLIGGTVIIETLFALPGVGRLLIEAINTRDLLMVQGGVLFIAAAFVLVNAVVDTIYAILDPRLRHGR